MLKKGGWQHFNILQSYQNIKMRAEAWKKPSVMIHEKITNIINDKVDPFEKTCDPSAQYVRV